jgi:uncharacterized membrane protein YhaH (DUF805 family)
VLHEERTREVLKRHKKWADGMALIWLIITIGVFSGAYFLMEQMGVSEYQRMEALIMLGAVILVISIWQAAGLVIARIELLRNRA